MQDLSYHERLKVLNLYSIQRRRERFVIIYMYKIHMNIVPNPGVQFKTNERTGVKAELPLIKANTPAYMKNMRMNSFGYLGPRLFNVLPVYLRNFEPTTATTNIIFAFKKQLDNFLAKIPDEPTDYGHPRQANTNSIIDQINYKRD